MGNGRLKPNTYDIIITEYFQELIGKDFEWGETHCTALCLGAIDKVFGTSYLDWHKETHNVDSAERALELSQQNETLAMFEHVGFRQVNKIHSGDVLYCISDEGYECLHIYSGGNFISCEIGGKVTLIPPRVLYHHLHLVNKEYSIWSCLR
jgi:hypothetical protein